MKGGYNAYKRTIKHRRHKHRHRDRDRDRDRGLGKSRGNRTMRLKSRRR